MPKTSLDAIDRKILKYLIKNARMPFLAVSYTHLTLPTKA